MTFRMWLTPLCFRRVCWLYSVTLNMLWDQYFPSSEVDKIISPLLNRTKWLQRLDLRHSSSFFSFESYTFTDFPINLCRISSVFVWNSHKPQQRVACGMRLARSYITHATSIPSRLAYCSSCCCHECSSLINTAVSESDPIITSRALCNLRLTRKTFTCG